MKLNPSIGFYLSLAGFVLAVLTALTAMLAGLGSRWGWWDFRAGFAILRWAADGGVVAAAASVAGFVLPGPRVPRARFALSLCGFIIALLIVGVLWSWWRTAQRVPAVHDITTDTEDPPRFVAVLPLRENAPNPAEYGGPEIAAKQHAAYPDLAPVILSVPPRQAFDRALQTAKGMGWELVDANSDAGRIEATDRTFWFGFKDDIVIRITLADSGSRIDVRSVSRVGRSDVGTNAKRVRKFLKRVKGGE